jgi:acyl dehydratase
VGGYTARFNAPLRAGNPVRTPISHSGATSLPGSGITFVSLVSTS